ncbi:MAG: hypothetical protein WA001_01175 [Patescibacteria group bacterium]
MKSPESAAQKPAHVTPEQRQAMLDSEDEISGVRERPKRTAESDRQAAAEATQKYLEYSQLHLDEAAMLSSELIKFQQNGLATADGIKNYRNKLQGIHDYLQTLGNYAEKLGAHQTDQIKHTAQRNAEMVRRIENTLQQSDELSARRVVISDRPKYAPSGPEQPSYLRPAEAPKAQPAKPAAKKPWYKFWS